MNTLHKNSDNVIKANICFYNNIYSLLHVCLLCYASLKLAEQTFHRTCKIVYKENRPLLLCLDGMRLIFWSTLITLIYSLGKLVRSARAVMLQLNNFFNSQEILSCGLKPVVVIGMNKLVLEPSYGLLPTVWQIHLILTRHDPGSRWGSVWDTIQVCRPDSFVVCWQNGKETVFWVASPSVQWVAKVCHSCWMLLVFLAGGAHEAAVSCKGWGRLTRSRRTFVEGRTGWRLQRSW